MTRELVSRCSWIAIAGLGIGLGLPVGVGAAMGVENGMVGACILLLGLGAGGAAVGWVLAAPRGDAPPLGARVAASPGVIMGAALLLARVGLRGESAWLVVPVLMLAVVSWGPGELMYHARRTLHRGAAGEV